MMAGLFFKLSKDSFAILSNFLEVSSLNTATVSDKYSKALPKFLTQNTIAASEGMADMSS